jgi:uncharacterized membrane protein YqjE
MTQQSPPAKQDRSLGELLAELTQEITTLVRQEITLARVEMADKAGNIGKQLGLLAVGGALAYSGVLAIVAALVIILATAGLPWWASALIVGVVVAGIGGALVKKGLDAIRGQDLVPRQTIETLKEIKHG